MKIYSFKDVYEGFGPLLIFEKDIQAARAFVVYLNDRPQYFVNGTDLYVMGEFFPDNGIISACPVCILTGKDAYPYIKDMKDDESYFPDLEEMLKSSYDFSDLDYSNKDNSGWC